VEICKKISVFVHDNIALIFVVEVTDAHVVRITGVININSIKIFWLCWQKPMNKNAGVSGWLFAVPKVGYNKWVTVMDGVKFEFNDIISLYTKTILSEDGLSAYNILYYNHIVIILFPDYFQNYCEFSPIEYAN